MLKYIAGNLFNSTTEAWVNTVNCKGVMGKGLALQFKHRFPEMYQAYHERCENGNLRPGCMDVFLLNKKPRLIINFPTKLDWRKPSEYVYIDSGLDELLQEYSSSCFRMPKWWIAVG